MSSRRTYAAQARCAMSTWHEMEDPIIVRYRPEGSSRQIPRATWTNGAAREICQWRVEMLLLQASIPTSGAFLFHSWASTSDAAQHLAKQEWIEVRDIKKMHCCRTRRLVRCSRKGSRHLLIESVRRPTRLTPSSVATVSGNLFG